MVRSITRALHAIEHLARSENDLGVVQISQELQLPRSTAHRILATLARAGYVLQDPRSERYRLTLKFVELGGLVQRQISLCDHARPYLRRLVQSTGESVALAVFDGLRVLVVDELEDPDRMWSRLAIGSQRPMHGTAAGKAVLAALTSAQLERLLSNVSLERYTERTIGSPRALGEQLLVVRSSGYAIEDEEHERGIRGVASVIRSRNGILGAIEIVGPTVRLSLDRVSELGRHVRLATEELSLSLGYELRAP